MVKNYMILSKALSAVKNNLQVKGHALVCAEMRQQWILQSSIKDPFLPGVGMG